VDPPRPWKTDAEIESESFRYSQSAAMQPLRPPTPRATFTLLGIMGGVLVLEWITLALTDEATFFRIWSIYAFPTWYDWINRPWSPFTATFAHHPQLLSHILFNSIGLFFFGPMIEQIVGRFRFVVLFIATGALSSIAQASLSQGPALGASGAIMALIGVAIIINPKAKIFLLFVPIPIPLWIGGLIFAAIDIIGAFNPGSGIGNIAHLSGLAIGLLFGLRVKDEMKERGLHFVSR
jgi:uncharacterized protein